MFKLLSFLQYSVLICILAVCFPGCVQEEFGDEAHYKLETLNECKSKKENVDKYIKQLMEVRGDWIDPYDMINKESNPLVSREEITVSTILPNKIILDSDFKPTFSDIRGEVIDGNSVADDSLTTSDHEIESGKLADVRQEICVLDSIYVTRWLKKLVSKIMRYSDPEPTLVSFSISYDALNALKDMSESKSLDIKDLDDLICKLISTATVTNRTHIDWSALIPYAVNVIWVLAWMIFGAFCSYTVYYCFVNHTKLSVIMCFVSITVFWHWMHLYKQMVAHKHAQLSALTMSNQCMQKDLGIFEHFQHYMKSIFADGDCKKYYEALMVDPVWEVSIMVAVSEAAAVILVQPLGAISRGLNTGLKSLFEGLPFCLSIVVVMIIFLVLIMRYNYKIKLPLFMGSLEPGMSSTSGTEDLALPRVNRFAEILQSSNSFNSSIANPYGLEQNSNVYPENAVMLDRNGSHCKSEKRIGKCQCKNGEEVSSHEQTIELSPKQSDCVAEAISTSNKSLVKCISKSESDDEDLSEFIHYSFDENDICNDCCDIKSDDQTVSNGEGQIELHESNTEHPRLS